ncbi:hypothetical protein SPI_03140 [Niveomyces insectorum RCEF 264]|uniref:Uncharacterized protein n=1 Tax=Niveomyces insectorum RCEF 264 TaxID=1081102 RepID=A0A167X3S2_9HYPO|nr:hypothetical protein SPI_03140 [Niveomyces insectorum RCEF 264]
MVSGPGNPSRSGLNGASSSSSSPRHPRNLSTYAAPGARKPSREGATAKPSDAGSRSNSGDSGSSAPLARSQTPLAFDRALTESPTEVRLAKKAEVTSATTVTIYPELDRYRNVQKVLPHMAPDHGSMHPDILFRLATQNLPPPPTPHFSGSNSLVSGISGSPSTRFSESPGPGPYSRDTTPTSMSSQSPGLVASVRIPSAPRMWQTSRGRAGSFGKDSSNEAGSVGAANTTHTLAAIRESLNSSSSSSNGTVRAGDKREKIHKKRLSPLPPSPPPRKSSQKFKKSEDERDSPSKSSAQPARPARPQLPQPAPKVIQSKTSATASSSAKATPPASLAPRQGHRAATLPRPTARPGAPPRPTSATHARLMAERNQKRWPLHNNHNGLLLNILILLLAVELHHLR